MTSRFRGLPAWGYTVVRVSETYGVSCLCMSMSLSMSVFMYGYMFVGMCRCMYVYMRMYMHMHMYFSLIYVDACLNGYAYAHV